METSKSSYNYLLMIAAIIIAPIIYLNLKSNKSPIIDYTKISGNSSLIEKVENIEQSTFFKPEGSKYSVIFPNTPTISKTSKIDPQGNSVLGELAELSSENGVYLRAEYSPLSDEEYNFITEKEAFSLWQEFAKKEGFKSPQIKYFTEGETKRVDLMGNKDLTLGNETRNFKYLYRIYYVRTTSFAVVVANNSPEFPGDFGGAFLLSVKLN